MKLKSIAVACSAALIGMSSHATTQTIQPNDITTPLVPYRLLGGDREFGGHGPDIHSSVRLRVGPDRRSLYADVYFHAKETVADWSETEGRWPVKVWEACPAQTISGIRSGLYSEVRFRSEGAGPQFGFPGEDWDELLRWIISAVKEYGDATPDQVRFAEAFRRGVATVSAGNKVYVKPPSSPSGPVEMFAIVGDTGGDDISTDENPKDDTRVQSISFKPVVLDIAGPGCTPTVGSTRPDAGGTGASTAPLTSAKATKSTGRPRRDLPAKLQPQLVVKSSLGLEREANPKASKTGNGSGK